MLIHLAMSPDKPSDDFTIDAIIDEANRLGCRVVDDRDALGTVSITSRRWQDHLYLVTTIGGRMIEQQA